MTTELTRIVDYTPIGEVKFVPKEITPFGYIDYIEGQTFSSGMYPELYHALGTNEFPPLLTKRTNGSLPLGTLIHTLNGDTPPSGFVIWEYLPGNLEGTDILDLFETVYSRLPYNDNSRQYWREAIENKTFPRLPTDVFLRVLKTGTLFDVGSYKPETYNINAFMPFSLTTPNVVPLADEANQTNKISGNLLITDNKGLADGNSFGFESGSYIYGVNTRTYESKRPDFGLLDKKFYKYTPLSQNVEKSNETYPANLSTVLLVKVNRDTNKILESGFKTVIRAYHSIDLPLQNVELALSKMTKVYEDTHQNMESYKMATESLKHTISNMEAVVLPEKIEALLKDLKDHCVATYNKTLEEKIPELHEELTKEYNRLHNKYLIDKADLSGYYETAYKSLCCVAGEIKKNTDPILEKLDIVHNDSRKIITKIIRDTFDEWGQEQDEKLDTLEENLEDAKLEINNKIDEEVVKVLNEINKVENKATDAINKLTEKTAQDKQELLTLVETVRSTLDNKINETKRELINITNALDSRIADLEDRLNNKVPNVTFAVPPTKESSHISTQFFGKGLEYLSTPHRWCTFDDNPNLVFPAYLIRGERE